MIDLKKTADHLAMMFRGARDYERVRDWCDIMTDGKLDAFALDLLTDELIKRLGKKR